MDVGILHIFQNYLGRGRDEIAVLDRGRKIAEGTPDEIRQNEEVIKAYFGSQDDH